MPACGCAPHAWPDHASLHLQSSNKGRAFYTFPFVSRVSSSPRTSVISARILLALNTIVQYELAAPRPVRVSRDTPYSNYSYCLLYSYALTLVHVLYVYLQLYKKLSIGVRHAERVQPLAASLAPPLLGVDRDQVRRGHDHRVRDDALGRHDRRRASSRVRRVGESDLEGERQARRLEGHGVSQLPHRERGCVRFVIHSFVRSFVRKRLTPAPLRMALPILGFDVRFDRVPFRPTDGTKRPAPSDSHTDVALETHGALMTAAFAFFFLGSAIALTKKASWMPWAGGETKTWLYAHVTAHAVGVGLACVAGRHGRDGCGSGGRRMGDAADRSPRAAIVREILTCATRLVTAEVC